MANKKFDKKVIQPKVKKVESKDFKLDESKRVFISTKWASIKDIKKILKEGK